MGDRPDDVISYRLFPPIAVGVPLLVGWGISVAWGDPFALGGWRRPVGWVLVLGFAVCQAWCMRTFARHQTGLLPGEATTTLITEGPFRFSRNPVYVGVLSLYLGLVLVAPTVWGLFFLPVVVLLLLWGAIWPEEALLRRLFGEEYAAYARRVRRWL